MLVNIPDLILVSILLVHVTSIWVQDGPDKRSLIGSPLSISPVSHPHLYSSESVRFQAADLILDQVQSNPNVAVIFHAMSGAGMNLVMAKLHGTDVKQTSLQTLPAFLAYDQIKYNNRTSHLYSICVNNPEHVDDPDPIAAAVDFVERHQLNLKSIYAIIDTKAIADDASYLDRMHRYLTDLQSQYERHLPLGRYPIKLVFNKVDSLDGPTLDDRARRVHDKIVDLAVSRTDSNIIATCAHESVGRLVSSLRRDLLEETSILTHKDMRQLQQRRTLLGYQLEMERTILQCDRAKLGELNAHGADPWNTFKLSAAALNWTTSALIDRNALPDMSGLLAPTPTDPPSNQENRDHALWALNWNESGSSRAQLADRMYDMDQYRDTKQQYDEFVDNCNKAKPELTRFAERCQAESKIKKIMTELKSSLDQHDGDVRDQKTELERQIKIKDEYIAQMLNVDHELMVVISA